MMTTTDGYGKRLGERLRVDNAPAIVTRVLGKADMAVTEIRCDHPLPGLSGSFQREDAFLVALRLRDFPGFQYWEEGRQAPVHDLRAGQIYLADLKRDPVLLLDRPYHSLQFYLPRAALDAIADEASEISLNEPSTTLADFLRL
jgi:AraC family transcriptional regulator